MVRFHKDRNKESDCQIMIAIKWQSLFGNHILLRALIPLFIEFRQFLCITLDTVYRYGLLRTDNNNFAGIFQAFYQFQLLVISTATLAQCFTHLGVFTIKDGRYLLIFDVV